MKRILLALSVLAIALSSTSCSEQRRWNQKQKHQMREALRQYRDMIYLQDLTDPEFIIFTDDVANDIELAYPVYTTFIEIPSVNDTVDMFVISTIVEELNEDAHNMRHLYPYRYLVSQGVLPDKLSHEQQRAFYKCFAEKVNSSYSDMNQFLNAILADTSATSQISQMQQQCASDLFNWVIEVDEVEVTQ